MSDIGRALRDLEAFDDAAKARDAVGFLGTPADCIRFLETEVLTAGVSLTLAVQALERVKALCASDSPVMDAWDHARELLLVEGNIGSLPRDVMETGLGEFWEVADDALGKIKAMKEAV